ncbi:LysR substrate-binding domain-containing protein [Microbispora sitophila]|uniref:LysR substrate-binding domain-containing protein n=1 Tax=Microbispora sitophila TaxID=2771537 RepID=UPI00299F5665|nr:LysR substrate-binding domain-containing protein [Microbispora sitophila]
MENDLVVGAAFSRQPRTLAVSTGHAFAGRSFVQAEELSGCELIGVDSPASARWRAAVAPAATPRGRPIGAGPRVGTLQEGLPLAAGRGAMLLCEPTAEYHGRRALTFVPVTGLPDSTLGLVWHRDHETARVRAFARALAETGPIEEHPDGWRSRGAARVGRGLRRGMSRAKAVREPAARLRRMRPPRRTRPGR